MNGNQTYSFAEQAASWLSGLEVVIYVTTGVIILAFQYPVYKRFPSRGLQLLIISTVLGLFVTVFDNTIGQRGPSDPYAWWRYYFGREIVWMAEILLGAAGTIMFLRHYAQLAAAAPKPSTPDFPTAQQSSQADRNT